MKLRDINEATETEPEEILGMLGSAAQKAFGHGEEGLPDRYARHTQLQADYKDKSPNPVETCGKCKYFEQGTGDVHKCKIVDGAISTTGRCRLWDG